MAYGGSQARSNQSYSRQPTPQPQQRRIQAAELQKRRYLNEEGRGIRTS